jgi:adenylate cyclase
MITVLSSMRKLVRQIGWLRTGRAVVALVLAVLIARFSWDLPLFIDAEHALYDARVVVASPLVRQDPRIVIVPYTDETLIATGKRSPLDRATLARALRRIDQLGAKAIGIDILIDQPQAEDPQLIAAFRSLRKPTFLAHATRAAASEKILYRQQQFLEQFQKAIETPFVHATTIVIQTDSDNVLRRWPEVAPGSPPIMPVALTGGVGAGYKGGILFRRPALKDEPVFNTIPIDTFANDELFANPEAAALFATQIRGKYVLIGGNIEDIDLFQTPLSRAAAAGEPRTEWGMNLFAVMLAQGLDQQLFPQLGLGAIWLIAVLAVLAGAKTAALSQNPVISGFAVLVQLALFGGAPFWLAAHHVDTYGLPAFGWLVGWFAGFLMISVLARALSSEQRRFAQGALGKYLPRDIAAEIMKDPDSLQLGGQKREIFVLFSDLEGFTKLSHAIEPEMVAFLLNRYLDMLSEVVLAHGGTIDKFVGDAVVAFWGAPISRPDDGRRSVEAAIGMQRAGEEFRANVPEGVPPIGRTRVGLHFGSVIVGNFGGEGRIQYTALGDAMNTAARLESANKQTKTGVLFSEDVVTRCGLDIFRPMGRVVLRGRASAIAIYEPVPDWSDEARRHYAAIAEAAMDGDQTAIAQMVEMAHDNPEDVALAQFVRRLQLQDGEDHYVLD